MGIRITALRVPATAIAALAIFASGPAIAQSGPFPEDDGLYAPDRSDDYYSPDEAGAERLAERMADPVTQDNVAHMVEGATAALMELPIGRFAAAMEQVVPGSVDRRRIHPDDRLGDIAGRDSRYLPQEMGHRTRAMMGAAGGFVQMFSAMLPEFKRLGREMADRVDTSIEDSYRRR